MNKPAIFTRDWWVGPPGRHRFDGYPTPGPAYFTMTYGTTPDREPILPSFQSLYDRCYSENPVVFGAIRARIALFSEAEFKFQDLNDRHLFGTNDPNGLAKLEQPWPGGTTGELLARMEQDVSLAGNAFVRDAGDRLERLRPDRVTIVSELVTDELGRQYRQVTGYFYDPGTLDPERDPDFYPVEEVAHWSPIPDPCATFRGMSWITPVVREVMADQALTGYKLSYLEHDATPNLIVKYEAKLKPETIDSIVDRLDARFGGPGNAGKTLILDAGGDATLVGNSLEQMNFSTVQAAGENRILLASGVPGIVIGSKEGLESASYSNYSQAMRSYADLTIRPQWRSVCAALAKLVAVPAGARLWYDTGNIAALAAGEQERAGVFQSKAASAQTLIAAGYEPASVALAVEASDLSLLTFTAAPAATEANNGA